MITAFGGQAAGGRPCPGRRIVQFGAPEINIFGATPATDEPFTVGPQCHRVPRTWHAEAAGERPSAARRIIELRTRANAATVAGAGIAACDKDLAVR